MSTILQFLINQYEPLSQLPMKPAKHHIIFCNNKLEKIIHKYVIEKIRIFYNNIYLPKEDNKECKDSIGEVNLVEAIVKPIMK